MKTLIYRSMLRRPFVTASLGVLVMFCGVWGCESNDKTATTTERSPLGRYESQDTRAVVTLVDNATALVQSDGEGALQQFRAPDTRWRRGEAYVFVLDPAGKMLVHPDPELEGKTVAELKDVNGKPIIRGLIDAATAVPGKTQGWYHYEWPVPGGLLPRWKSSYVRLATAPSGKQFVVGSGMYNDRMERAFVEDMVNVAAAQIQARGKSAFDLLRDRTGPMIAKDAYVFVTDPQGVELVNPAFPNLEGRSLIDVKDKNDKRFVREMLDLVGKNGSGWVDYLWPKPGESVATQKSAYVSKVNLPNGGGWVLVGAGVYLADAPKAAPDPNKMTASQLMALVREGAALFERMDEAAYPQFRQKGSKWFRGDTYFAIYTLAGIRTFHAPDPSLEGKDIKDDRDIMGRPYGQMFLAVGASPSGEGWVHYLYPEPGDIFPVWKSAFVKRVKAPSGQQYLIRSAVYNMQMDKAFITDVVDRAATMVEKRGQDAFSELRDRKGPFFFMDTYVFVTSTEGTQLVNPGYPSLEGKNILDMKDVKGKALVRDYINAASKSGSAWVEYYWYKPGTNEPLRKQAYVRMVNHGSEKCVVGSGLYGE